MHANQWRGEILFPENLLIRRNLLQGRWRGHFFRQGSLPFGGIIDVDVTEWREMFQHSSRCFGFRERDGADVNRKRAQKCDPKDRSAAVSVKQWGVHVLFSKEEDTRSRRNLGQDHDNRG
jgi:hypothetical protein